ncbi:MAG: hypothetical protein JWM14_280 [Chitinophagaceae bacterium]|nr:hypothetical protein [Chitinophagaceae bacterium]
MEYLKFVFWAVLFVIYVVSQVRKMKMKAEQEKALQPEPVKPLVSKPVATVSKKVFDYKGKREMKSRERKPIFAQKEMEHKPITYKPVADEELIAEALLQDRKMEEKALKEDRKPLADEHLEPYTDHSKNKMNLDWLKDKANLKRTFIAAEIFQRKY